MKRIDRLEKKLKRVKPELYQRKPSKDEIFEPEYLTFEHFKKSRADKTEKQIRKEYRVYRLIYTVDKTEYVYVPGRNRYEYKAKLRYHYKKIGDANYLKHQRACEIAFNMLYPKPKRGKKEMSDNESKKINDMLREAAGREVEPDKDNDNDNDKKTGTMDELIKDSVKKENNKYKNLNKKLFGGLKQ